MTHITSTFMHRSITWLDIVSNILYLSAFPLKFVASHMANLERRSIHNYLCNFILYVSVGII
jgi:hypothetical protein